MHGEIIIEFVMAELLQISCPPPSGHPQSLSSEHPQRNRSEFLNLIIILIFIILANQNKCLVIDLAHLSRKRMVFSQALLKANLAIYSCKLQVFL